MLKNRSLLMRLSTYLHYIQGYVSLDGTILMATVSSQACPAPRGQLLKQNVLKWAQIL